MSNRRVTAIIVGGGIAGPAAALALKRVGIDAVVYEGHAQSDNLSGGMSLAPNGMHVLAQLGLADAVLRAGAVMTDACYRNQQGRVLATHPFGRVETYGQPAVGLPRAALHRVLANGLAEAGIQIHYSKRLAGLTDTPGSPVTATFDDGTSAEGDFVIGTDGIHSKTRALILQDAPQPEFIGVLGYGAFVSNDVVSPADPADAGRINMTFGRSGMFGYCKASTQPNRWMWWFNATAADAPSRMAIEAIPTEELRADLLRQCEGWHDPIEAFIAHAESFARVRIFDVPPLPAWSSGRVLLMGDAAHAMSPASGQGASTALEDALYLAHLLRVPGTPLADVFGRFVQERQPRVEKINAEARRVSNRKKPMGPVGAWMRDRMFSLLLPRMALRSFDWKFRYRVPFEV